MVAAHLPAARRPPPPLWRHAADRAAILLLAVLLLAGGTAGAQSEPAPEPAPPAPPAAAPLPTPTPTVAAPADAPKVRRDAAESTRNGLFLPLTQAATIGQQRVTVLLTGGGDSLSTPTFTAADGTPGGGLKPVGLMYVRVEGALFSWVSLFVSAEYDGTQSEAARYFNPAAGLRLRLLNQKQHAINLGLGVLYRNHGFSEPGGEMEVSLLVSRRWDRFGVYGNLVYGQGFAKPDEGKSGINTDDRDAELRLAALYFLGEHFNFGFDLRGRINLSNGGPDPAAPADGDYDILGGAVATAAVGPVMFLAQAGGHGLRQHGGYYTGFVGLGGLGLSF